MSSFDDIDDTCNLSEMSDCGKGHSSSLAHTNSTLSPFRANAGCPRPGLFSRFRSISGQTVNPRRTGTPDFPSPTRGVFEHPPPRLSPLLLVVEKNRKKRWKDRQKWLRNYFSEFFAKVKIVAPRAKKCKKILVFFSRLSNIDSENLYYLGNYYS